MEAPAVTGRPPAELGALGIGEAKAVTMRELQRAFAGLYTAPLAGTLDRDSAAVVTAFLFQKDQSRSDRWYSSPLATERRVRM
jgi:hypothetical protein